MKPKALTQWEEATQAFAEYFRDRYFSKNAESWWVAEEIGDVYVISDYFFDLQTMVDFVKYSYSSKDMFEYYDYSLEVQTTCRTTPVCIRDWKKREKSF